MTLCSRKLAWRSSHLATALPRRRAARRKESVRARPCDSGSGVSATGLAHRFAERPQGDEGAAAEIARDVGPFGGLRAARHGAGEMVIAARLVEALADLRNAGDQQPLAFVDEARSTDLAELEGRAAEHMHADDEVRFGRAGAGERREQAAGHHELVAELEDAGREDRFSSGQSVVAERADIMGVGTTQRGGERAARRVGAEPAGAFAADIAEMRLAGPIDDDEIGQQL